MEITNKEELEFYDQNNIFNDFIATSFEIESVFFDKWLDLGISKEQQNRISTFQYCASSGRIYQIYRKRNDYTN